VSTNLQQPKHGKYVPNQQPLDNQSKTHDKKGKGKMKNETRKWCDFHKIPWHNIDECCSKHSLVLEVKDTEPNPNSEYDPKNIENRQIINTYPTTIVAKRKIQPKEPIDPKEGEHLFHSIVFPKKRFVILKMIHPNSIG
jgi:hypothetical protein